MVALPLNLPNCPITSSTPILALKRPVPGRSSAAGTMRTLPSVLLSILIAFFPKCPACCIAYLSMFGSVGLAVTPYVEWLYPLLLASLGLHLGLLLAKAHR